MPVNYRPISQLGVPVFCRLHSFLEKRSVNLSGASPTIGQWQYYLLFSW